MPTAFDAAPSSTSPSRSRSLPSGRRRPLRALAWTVASLAAVTIVKMAAFAYIGEATPFLLYFVAIRVAAWHDAWRGGLVATALSALLGILFFLPPFGTLQLHEAAGVVRVAVFVLEGVAITAVTARL